MITRPTAVELIEGVERSLASRDREGQPHRQGPTPERIVLNRVARELAGAGDLVRDNSELAEALSELSSFAAQGLPSHRSNPDWTPAVEI